MPAITRPTQGGLTAIAECADCRKATADDLTPVAATDWVNVHNLRWHMNETPRAQSDAVLLRETAETIHDEHAREDVDDLEVSIFYLAAADLMVEVARVMDLSGGAVHTDADRLTVSLARNYQGGVQP